MNNTYRITYNRSEKVSLMTSDDTDETTTSINLGQLYYVIPSHGPKNGNGQHQQTMACTPFY